MKQKFSKKELERFEDFLDEVVSNDSSLVVVTDGSEFVYVDYDILSAVDDDIKEYLDMGGNFNFETSLENHIMQYFGNTNEYAWQYLGSYNLEYVIKELHEALKESKGSSERMMTVLRTAQKVAKEALSEYVYENFKKFLQKN